jgi:hypothetical protein
MTPGNYPLDLYRGDTYTWQFRLWRDPDKLNEVDLTNCASKAEIRPQTADTVVIPLLTIITLPNLIHMQLDANLWDDLYFTSGVWDLEIVFPDAYVATFVAGKVTVRSDVTNSSVTP